MIYLIRHADAVSPDVDPLRPLSERGRGQVERLCAALRARGGFEPAEFWHSPLARARETAHGIAGGLGLASAVVLREGLEPDDDPTRLLGTLEAERRDIALVGHEPHLGILATVLVHGPAHGGILFPFPKAGVLALARDGNGWRHEWVVRSP